MVPHRGASGHAISVYSTPWPSRLRMHTIQQSASPPGTAQSTSVGNPTCSDLAVNLSVEDASTLLDAYRLGHLAVEVLVQTPPLHVQSGHSKVRHENPSCAVMGPS